MLHHIRPHRIFRLHETASYGERLVQLVLPDDRTPQLLETAVLVSLARACGVRRYFEFGCLHGIQTLNLAANLPAGARVFTLDLDEPAFAAAHHVPADRAIAARRLRAASAPAFVGTRFEDRVTTLFGDSNHFDFGPYGGSMDMVYVDGGHDLRTLASDTRNALAMLADRPLACVVWHDYGNPVYPHLTDFLDAAAEDSDLYHVEETMLCIYLHDAPARIRDALTRKAA
ncbi:MAG: class I SAM-dependent methyltransferase [Candidatus Krumholzibacteriia bacterium]